MKRAIIFLVLITNTLFVNAQEWTWAPEAGLNISNVTGKGLDMEPKLGVKAGLVFNMPLSEVMFLQPGVFYSQKGFRNDSVRNNLNYIEVPLNLMYRLKLKKSGSLFASAGLYGAYALYGRTIDDRDHVSTKISFGSKQHQINPWGFGANMGVGYELPINLYIRAQYGIGLISIYNGTTVDTRHRLFQFTIGYLVGRD
jgi:hypothetical protein